MNTKPDEWLLDKAMPKIPSVLWATSSRQSLAHIGVLEKIINLSNLPANASLRILQEKTNSKTVY
jgi:hypothetical protein